MSRFFGAGESEALLSNEALRSPSAASPTKLISIHNTYIDIRIDIDIDMDIDMGIDMNIQSKLHMNIQSKLSI